MKGCSNFLKKALLSSIIAMSTFLSVTSYAYKHEVKSGDTYFKLASYYNTTVSELTKWNPGVSASNLSVGYKLTIPYESYKVASGDSLYKISQKYNTSVSAIKSLNGLTSDNIEVGTKLDIIKGFYGTGSGTSSSSSTGTSSSSSIYTVVSGDTLYKIAQKCGITVQDLKSLNGLSSDYLSIGQALKVPNASAVAVSNNPLKRMPFASRNVYDGVFNNYASPREWSPNGATQRTHEGIDMMAKEGTAVYAVADGKIVNYGWNQYGGWRVNIQLTGGKYHTYYAHFSKYAPGLYIGKQVKAGDLLGYVGSTGYGPEGTSGKFDPHLHFGLYDKNMVSLNPYNYLKDLENKAIFK